MGEDEIVIRFQTLPYPPGLSCLIQVQWSMVDKPSKPDLLPLPALSVDVEAKAFRLMWDALYPLLIATSP